MKKKKKIALIGSDGQLGLDLQKTLQTDYEMINLTIQDLDITNNQDLDKVLSKLQPDIVFSTAGYHNVPYCELTPAKTYEVNTVGAKFLSDWCFHNKRKFVFVSSDYVFDGQKNSPYTEKDIPNPINTYGISKFAAELYIKHNLKDFLIIRTTGLYGSNQCIGKNTPNFVEMVISLIQNKKKQEFDGSEICCPTYTLDLAKQLLIMLRNDLKGIYHVVNQGPISWFNFAKEIISYLDLDVDLIKKKRLPDIEKAKKLSYKPLYRPKYTALKNHNLEVLKLNQMSSVIEALHSYLANRPSENI